MYDNRCVCCGVIIPEGLQVCPACVAKAHTDNWLYKVDAVLNNGKRSGTLGTLHEVLPWIEDAIKMGAEEIKMSREQKCY